jgi:integrase/recombinase XerD
MDPRKDPTRQCRALAAWPDADRRAWAAALSAGDFFEPGGTASAWKPRTRYTVERSHGRWLTWLDHQQLLHPDSEPADRVTRENLGRYIRDLEAVNASYTVLSRLRNLYNAMRAMAPGEDWAWLLTDTRRRRRRVASVRNKRSKMIPSDELFAYGVKLMEDADATTERTPLQKAEALRDGLIIALLAARPLRRANFAAIEIGRHLVR